MSYPRVTDYNTFVFNEIRTLGRAWADANGITPTSQIDPEFWYEKIGELSWRRLCDEKPMAQILTEIGVNPADYLPPPPPFEVRTGILHPDGRAVRDDQGRMRPIGCSLMWAIAGWRDERDRVKQN